MNGGKIGASRTKWWGVDRHIVIYYTAADRSSLYFVTSVPEPGDWITEESWSAKGDVEELRAAYEGFHPEVQMVLNACPDCHKWAILEREPLPTWSEGRVALLGDACHPMTPYMAQGAATSIEDAAVLARCLAEVDVDGIESAFNRYEANRKPRTSKIRRFPVPIPGCPEAMRTRHGSMVTTPGMSRWLAKTIWPWRAEVDPMQNKAIAENTAPTELSFATVSDGTVSPIVDPGGQANRKSFCYTLWRSTVPFGTMLRRNSMTTRK